MSFPFLPGSFKVRPGPFSTKLLASSAQLSCQLLPPEAPHCRMQSFAVISLCAKSVFQARQELFLVKGPSLQFWAPDKVLSIAEASDHSFWVQL